MIFGQVMAKIRHGGRRHTVAIRPFLAVVGCCVIFLVAVAQKMSAGYFRSAGFLGSSKGEETEVVDMVPYVVSKSYEYGVRYNSIVEKLREK
jgi:hypothetical protein